MSIVWIIFAVIVAMLAFGAWATKYFCKSTPVFRTVGRFLLAMAVVTVLFPTLLPVVGVSLWVGGYIAFVVIVTAAMTVSVVLKAKRTAQ